MPLMKHLPFIIFLIISTFTFSQEKGEMTLEEQSEREKKDTIKQLMQDKRVKEILQTFPGSTMGDIIEEEEKDE